jgi:hypothetical protein
MNRTFRIRVFFSSNYGFAVRCARLRTAMPAGPSPLNKAGLISPRVIRHELRSFVFAKTRAFVRLYQFDLARQGLSTHRVTCRQFAFPSANWLIYEVQLYAIFA